MKTRSGFVSNSSSSSFCILGIEANDELFNKVGGKYKEMRELGVQTEYAVSGGDEKYVGIDVTSMKDDETPRMLKKRLMDALNTIGVTVEYADIDFIEDGGYNG